MILKDINYIISLIRISKSLFWKKSNNIKKLLLNNNVIFIVIQISFNRLNVHIYNLANEKVYSMNIHSFHDS
jgi:hypothetical protein